MYSCRNYGATHVAPAQRDGLLPSSKNKGPTSKADACLREMKRTRQVIYCWGSPAQSFLVSGTEGSMIHNFYQFPLSQKFLYIKDTTKLKREEFGGVIQNFNDPICNLKVSLQCGC
jgi:hypothetical protein